MFKRGRRQTVFVCSAIINSQLISEILTAESSEDAAKKFQEAFNVKAQKILGPFIKKRSPILEVKTPIKFEGKPRQAIYDGWLVNAFLLKEPENSAFLIFIKREDGQQKQSPKGTTIVSINDLRFI